MHNKENGPTLLIRPMPEGFAASSRPTASQGVQAGAAEGGADDPPSGGRPRDGSAPQEEPGEEVPTAGPEDVECSHMGTPSETSYETG